MLERRHPLVGVWDDIEGLGDVNPLDAGKGRLLLWLVESIGLQLSRG
jgi:hypothetical protein